MSNILPTGQLINMVAIMSLNDDDKNLIIGQLNRYAHIMGKALEYISSDGCEQLEVWNNNDQTCDFRLLPDEAEAWVGLCASLGYDFPLPENYVKQGQEDGCE